MDLATAAVIIMGGWTVVIVAALLAAALRPGGIMVSLPARAGGGAPPSGSGSGPRDAIPLGVEAESLGTPLGRVNGVYLDPSSRQVTALAVGSGIGESRYVPVDTILAADGERLTLANRAPELPAEVYERDTAIALRANAAVLSTGRHRLGRLQVVSMDRSSRLVTALVVAGGRGGKDRRALPMERVVSVGASEILTDLRANQWDALQPYATDREIKEAIEERIAADPALEPYRRSLTIEVHDQRVRLRGYVGDSAAVERVAGVARSVTGVLQIDRAITNDQDLAAAVGQALSMDSRTKAATVRVEARFGSVDILGNAPDAATVRAIDAVARRVSGLQTVHNMVRVAQPRVAPAT